MNTNYYKILIPILLFFFSSCLKQKTLHDLKYQEIYNFIENTQLFFNELKSGIFLHSNFEGINPKFSKGDSVKMVYSAAYLSNGELNYFAKDDTFSFVAGDREILSAWNQVVKEFGVAGSGIVLIPYDKAYGKEHTPNIPSYSNLVYYFRFYSTNYAIDQLSIFYKYTGEQTEEINYSNDTLAYIKYFDGSDEDSFPETVQLELSLSTVDNDSLFYENDNYYFTPSSTNLPEGVQEGILNMKQGEMGKIIIPPNLSFQEENTFNINPLRSIYAIVRRKGLTHKDEEISQINKFLYLNNLTPDSVLTDSIYYIRNEKGTGEQISYGDVINYSDSLYLINSETQISSCQDCQKTFNNQNFENWQIETIGLMYEGEKATFIIPYSQAYGATGNGNIPPYSTLVYQIYIKSKEQ